MKALFIPKAPEEPYFQEISEENHGRTFTMLKGAPGSNGTAQVATFEPRGSFNRKDRTFLCAIFEEV